jgi:hypothetical protein
MPCVRVEARRPLEALDHSVFVDDQLRALPDDQQWAYLAAHRNFWLRSLTASDKPI